MDNQNNYQAPQQNQPIYQAPQQPYYDPTTQVMSVGEYVGMFILLAIPIVNIICWIVWLCSKKTNKNKKNYIIANIILWVIGVIVCIIFYAIFGASMLAASDPTSVFSAIHLF